MRGIINLTLILFLIACGMISGCGGEKEPRRDDLQNKKVVGIILRENTVMRVDPLLYSGRVTLLKRAEIVEVMDKSREAAAVGDATGFWYKVKIQNGISGWVWGKNIQFFTDKSQESINGFISSYWEQEAKRVMKSVTGKWWSVDKRGDFTTHALEISQDGKYKSYLRGGNPINGEYNVNFKDNEIIFLKGTTFNTSLNIIQRGTMLYLEKETDKEFIKFQKTSSTLDDGTKESANAAEESGDAN